ncbi:HAD family hydrolase [Ectothiorhodospiraceae bacterium WFHF3C12]|nr:HAD family hydrolase [Ectothiorhodospiraceae bacterium WFHF3C12]
MKLAIFDLDNTLIAGDSDHLWGAYLVERGIVDRSVYEAANDRFFRQYRDGTLDIDAYLRFALAPLADNDPEDLWRWRREFVARLIQPIVLPAARGLVEDHREQGHYTLILTATNRFVTEPIAGIFGVDALLATEPEWRDGRYTGAVTGRPTFREGKVDALMAWIEDRDVSLDDSVFYSDSHNDLPLLERVREPVAVDPDPQLREVADRRDWPVITLRQDDTDTHDQSFH